MKLHSKQLLATLFFTISLFVHSQEVKPKEIDPETLHYSWNDDHYVNFHLGFYQPISIGDNFANEALSHKVGFEAAGYFNFGTSKLLLGLKYALFYSEVSNIERVGDYDKSEIGNLSLMIGYHLARTLKWRAVISAGAGPVQYSNVKGTTVFSDTGISVWINPSLQYHFNKTFGLHFSTSYRRDKLQINTPKEFQDYFDSADYINLGLGLSIIL